ncbi:histidine protein methyltransferase 1 homolog [Cloeon dipterum]|uniref:histidine protein methyltransferase 1 homolog n=1 Tax=Cloeon dipterum TaxID=197152 RepID=UPI00321FBD35
MPDIMDTCDSSSDLSWQPAKEMVFNCDPLLPSSYLHTCGKISLELGVAEDVLKIIEENEESCVKSAESQNSDLIPAFYEGGLKVWECTDDLLGFLSNPSNIQQKLKDSAVLDLGCGSGAVGISCLMCEASQVHFQDYNEEVIKYYTRPNVTLNFPGVNVEDKVRYFSGDWESFCGLVQDVKYDLIFTSETIYNPDCYKKLLKVFKQLLKPEGHVYVAAKTYYFGVGGGTRQFEEALETDGVFKSEVVWKFDAGLNREILKLTWL